MTDHQIALGGAVFSALALVVSYLSYRDTKNKNYDDKTVKMRVAVGNINELIRPFKKLKIIKIELLTQDNQEHDNEILKSFLERLKLYRKDLAELPEAISNVVFLLEASAIKIVELNVSDLDVKIENYYYDEALQAFNQLYLDLWLISDYIYKIALPTYVISGNEYSTYFFQIHNYYKELTGTRANERSISMQADMEDVKVLLETLKKEMNRSNV